MILKRKHMYLIDMTQFAIRIRLACDRNFSKMFTGLCCVITKINPQSKVILMHPSRVYYQLTSIYFADGLRKNV